MVLGDSESDWGEVLSGVPQGSVLGPLLFILYINDLPDSVECDCKLYADDNKLISVVRNGLEGIGMQNNIDSVTNWTKDWLMRLNASKCKVMHLGNSNPIQVYEVEDVNTGLRKPMGTTTCEKDQGLFIMSDLKWTDQAYYAASIASRAQGLLRKTFSSRNSQL